MTIMPDRTNRFSVGLVQMSCGTDPAANLEKAVHRIGEAAAGGAQIVCLQELFRSQYFCQRQDPALFDLAEDIPGATTKKLSETARSAGIVLVASLFERRVPGVYHNTAVVFDADGSMLGLYRKMHIPDDPLYCEKYYFTPGDLGFRAFDTRFARIGVLVCWDQWYPEAARLTALQGAEILLYPTAIGWHPAEKSQYGASQHEAWQMIQRSHALANGVFVASVNRVGHEKLAGEGLEFWGASFVCDPFGNVLKKGTHDREEIVIASCDRGRIEEVRRNWPFLRDRRIDAYGGLLQRTIE
jgi:N-carbamoylputrescine amidase